MEKTLFYIHDDQLELLMRQAVYDWFDKFSHPELRQSLIPDGVDDPYVKESVENTVLRALHEHKIMPHMIDESLDDFDIG